MCVEGTAAHPAAWEGFVCLALPTPCRFPNDTLAFGPWALQFNPCASIHSYGFSWSRYLCTQQVCQAWRDPRWEVTERPRGLQKVRHFIGREEQTTKYLDPEHSKGEKLATKGIRHHAGNDFDISLSIMGDYLPNTPSPLSVLSLQHFRGFCLMKQLCR